MPTLVSKHVFLTGGVLYITVLALTLLLIDSTISGRYKPYQLIPTLLLLPGLPPSPTFVSKLWAVNMFSFGVIIPLLLMLVLVNIYIIVTYTTFFLYQTETFTHRKNNNIDISKGLVVIWIITTSVLLNPLNSVHH